MDMTPTQLAEYREMRGEILMRAKLHHLQLNLATVLQLISLAVVFWLPSAAINVFLLIVPVVFAGLAFNYQANQCTMEIAAAYLGTQYGQAGLQWEEFFGREKSKYKLTSFLKTFALWWPLSLPLILWIYTGWPKTQLTSSLMVLDLVLLALVLINFRYKLSR
jgi:hypothetical protein